MKDCSQDEPPKIIIPYELYCPHCGARHIEQKRGANGERWDRRAHTTHTCAECGGEFDVFVEGA